MEASAISKLDLSALCMMCIVEHKLDSNNLIIFAKYVQEKREELRNLFQKNVEINRTIN